MKTLRPSPGNGDGRCCDAKITAIEISTITSNNLLAAIFLVLRKSGFHAKTIFEETIQALFQFDLVCVESFALLVLNHVA